MAKQARHRGDVSTQPQRAGQCQLGASRRRTRHLLRPSSGRADRHASFHAHRRV